MAMNAQDIKDLEWKNRLVLVIAENKENKDFQKQLTELQQDKAGLKERKLIIFKILPDQFSRGLESETWENGSALYQEYITKASGFQVFLIGLDGRVKLVQSEILSLRKLFNTIDSMPMRQAEMRKNN